jgi:hypothetical protein
MAFSPRLKFGSILLLLSILFYSVHYFIFRDLYHIEVYLLGDLAFLPIDIIIVILIIDKLLSEREKTSKLEKLNMVIGAFYSEVGTRLLKMLSEASPTIEEIRLHLAVTEKWSNSNFKSAVERLASSKKSIDISSVDLTMLKDVLVSKRDFMLRLLENPILLEHESFTDVLRAVFHLTEELDCRPNTTKLPKADLAHLQKDMERAYETLTRQWIENMMHLKKNYPYLFSLSMRTNPFLKDSTPVIK